MKKIFHKKYSMIYIIYAGRSKLIIYLWKSAFKSVYFSGESSLSIYQDFHSKVFTKNLIWVLASPAQDTVEKAREEDQQERQLNMTQAISKSKDTLFLLFKRPAEKIAQLIQQIYAVFIYATEPIRPGRKFERNHKVNKCEHYMNYKPCR